MRSAIILLLFLIFNLKASTFSVTNDTDKVSFDKPATCQNGQIIAPGKNLTYDFRVTSTNWDLNNPIYFNQTPLVKVLITTNSPTVIIKPVWKRTFWKNSAGKPFKMWLRASADGLNSPWIVNEIVFWP